MLEMNTLEQRQLINGSTSDFGNVRLGESYIKSYRIVNRTDAPLMLAPPTLQGEIDSFFLLQAPESNRTVPPNGFYEFKAEFRPARTGLINATLTVDGRTIKLVSNGLEGEVPDFRLLPSAADVESVSQADARIEVVSAAAQALSGTLTLVFEGDVGGMPDDTNIRFIATGNRSIAFTVPAGSTRALFAGGSSDAARFQTGAASGKIRLVAKLGQWERSAQLNIRSDAPKLASGSLQARLRHAHRERERVRQYAVGFHRRLLLFRHHWKADWRRVGDRGPGGRRLWHVFPCLPQAGSFSCAPISCPGRCQCHRKRTGGFEEFTRAVSESHCPVERRPAPDTASPHFPAA